MNNIDGFSERRLAFLNSNDKRNQLPKVDNSLAQMMVKDNSADVETANHDSTTIPEEAKGNKENFVIRNYKINTANAPIKSNPVSDALNRNRYKKF